MRTALIRMAIVGAMAMGGTAFAGIGAASAACVHYAGGIVCGKPAVKKRYYKRHHGPRVVLRFGAPQRYYHDRYYNPRPVRRYYKRHHRPRAHWGAGIRYW
ncbi:MAG: hypothetical protein AB7I79_08665 [Rhizobiaceae bacterium]